MTTAIPGRERGTTGPVVKVAGSICTVQIDPATLTTVPARGRISPQSVNGGETDKEYL